MPGDDFDEAIVKYVKKKYGLMIGEQTAEEIKIAIGTAFEKPEPKVMEVKGRDLVTGLPKTIRVTSEDTRDALKEVTGADRGCGTQRAGAHASRTCG